MLFFAEIFFHDLDKYDHRTELQIILQQAIRLANKVPDHKISGRLYEHQGILNRAWLNYSCALKAFIKMKDVAEDIGYLDTMMRAYLQLATTF